MDQLLNRKVRIIKISHELLLNLLRKEFGAFHVPVDAIVLHTETKHANGTVDLYVHSDDFEQVLENTEPERRILKK